MYSDQSFNPVTLCSRHGLNLLQLRFLLLVDSMPPPNQLLLVRPGWSILIAFIVTLPTLLQPIFYPSLVV